MAEFTGERVVPGQVGLDLWNEHLARYAFAARLAGRKRVLELGCGMGYGAALLSGAADEVIALDNAAAAVGEAAARYRAPNLHFLAGSAAAPPFADASFQLVVAFEVIEHLKDWGALLDQARRLLAPGGQFMLSTPNREYYAASRAEAGPNPYHEHEFDYAEFRSELESRFPQVSLFVQNHVQGIVFAPCGAATGASMVLPSEREGPVPEAAHFFVAVCALAPQTGSPTYFYLPGSGNLLEERERHIGLLEHELAAKSGWLKQLEADHAALVQAHGELHAAMAERAAWVSTVEARLEERTSWATSLETEVEGARALVAQLQVELESRAKWAFEQEAEVQRAREIVAEVRAEAAAARAAIAEYEERVTEVEAQLEETVVAAARAAETQAAEMSAAQAALAAKCAELEAKCQELGRSVALLHQAEETVEERTRWAQSLDARIAELESTLETAGASRWVRLGNRLGMGPNLKRF